MEPNTTDWTLRTGELQPYTLNIIGGFFGAPQGASFVRPSSPTFEVAPNVQFTVSQTLYWLPMDAPEAPANIDLDALYTSVAAVLTELEQRYVYRLSVERPHGLSPIPLLSTKLRLNALSAREFDPEKDQLRVIPDEPMEVPERPPGDTVTVTADLHPPCCRCGQPIDWEMSPEDRVRNLPYALNPLCTACYTTALV